MKTRFLKTTIVAALLAVSALAVSQTSAAASPMIYISGNSCMPQGTGVVDLSQYGIYEFFATSSVDVICPLVTDGQPWPNFITLQVNGYNRNARDPLSCTLMITDEFGNLSDTLKATASAAGAPFISVSETRMGPSSLRSPNLSLTCHIPYRTLDLGFSHLTTVVVLRL